MKNSLAEISPNPCTTGHRRLERPIWHDLGTRALRHQPASLGPPPPGRGHGLPARPMGACSQSNRAPRPPQAAAGGRWHECWLAGPGLVPWLGRGHPARQLHRRGGPGGEAAAQRDPPCTRAAVSQGALCKCWRVGPAPPLGLSPRPLRKRDPPPAGAIKRPGGPRGALASLVPRTHHAAARLARSSRR